MGLLELTALELGKQIKEKKVSVKEAVEASFSRIRESEETVHAFITLEEEKALKNAEEVQARIDAGELSGPLAGVPMAVKDNMHRGHENNLRLQNPVQFCTGLFGTGGHKPEEGRSRHSGQDKYG